MLSFENLEKEAHDSFDELLKTKPGIYNEADRNNFVMGYIKAEYERIIKMLTVTT